MKTQELTADSDNPASRWVSLLLGLMMILTPAMGVPSEEMLQDTLKSAIVANITLLAALTYWGIQLRHPCRLRFHWLLILPAGLACYAAISMTWSHTYLAGVETARWLIFSVLMWLCINLHQTDFENRVLGGIHWGLTIASMWSALQFWANISPFPQGPNPASTFLNRNFFAEFLVCALPISGYMLWRSTSRLEATFLAASTGFNTVALFMTGTRSAVLAFIALVAVLVLSRLFATFRTPTSNAQLRKQASAVLVLIVTIVGLGSIPTNNPKLIAEFGRQTAIERSLSRVASVAKPNEYATGSFSMRYDMWRSTARMIYAAPITGVGAGAWEVYIPIYQNAGTQLEADYYAHNEIIQLVAEYGLAGWTFLLVLIAFLCRTFWNVWRKRNDASANTNAVRATGLLSLFMLLIVSNAGFPWRMAGTASLFAIGLSMVITQQTPVTEGIRSIPPKWSSKRVGTIAIFIVSIAALCVALYVTGRAAASERSLIRGIKLALTISHSPAPTSSYWDEPKKELVSMLRDGIFLNPHYRKLVPVAADELARMGDWQDAQWIWESVLESRPYIVAIMANIARAHIAKGEFRQAQAMLDRARNVQPSAPVLRSLNILLLVGTRQDTLAAQELRELFQQGIVDMELVQAAYIVSDRQMDWELKIQALELRARHWPSLATEAWLEAGSIYATKMGADGSKHALEAFRAAIAATPELQREAIRQRIPPSYRKQL